MTRSIPKANGDTKRPGIDRTRQEGLLHPLLLLLAQATEKELVLHIEYLKAENRILRSKLPKRIRVTPAERARLVKLGIRLGSASKKLITIVHPWTFARWISEGKSKSKPRKRGQRQKPEEIRQLIIQMAKDTGRVGWLAVPSSITCPILHRLLGHKAVPCVRRCLRTFRPVDGWVPDGSQQRAGGLTS